MDLISNEGVHRNDIDIEKDQLLMIKSFLESKGVTVSGGITYTVNNVPGADDNKHRLFGTFCYTEPLMRKKVKQIAEYTASIFDEIILDDFYFTFCKCDRCIKEKGDRDWVSFRKELMTDVSKNLVVGPAKAEELMFFMWDDLIDNRFVGAMKYQLDKIDDMLEGTGNPTGLATYIPHASNGENHIEMRLGMLGIPIDMTPDFPKDKKVILLTESSAADENVVESEGVYASGKRFLNVYIR